MGVRQDHVVKGGYAVKRRSYKQDGTVCKNSRWRKTFWEVRLDDMYSVVSQTLTSKSVLKKLLN